MLLRQAARGNDPISRRTEAEVDTQRRALDMQPRGEMSENYVGGATRAPTW